MAIPPIGNSASMYPTVFQSGNAGRIGAATQADKPEINPQQCKT